MNKYDKRHLANVKRYQKRIDDIYRQAAAEAAALGHGFPAPADGIFSIADHPALQAQIDALLADMRRDIEFTVTDGVRTEWDLSNAKNDALVDSVLAEHQRLAKYYRTNTEARDAFLARKIQGLNLSDRVWKYTNGYKTEIELALDCGIREGLDAASMARQMQQYLKFPDMLFRRVRDEHGILQLSQRAAEFHPGQGVYRSSYKNARRLAATETNIAYNTADHERWQQLDFVVGIRVSLSNNHTCLNRKGKAVPFHDICDILQGEYPKDFKFVGWHPHCRCIQQSILMTREEMDERFERRLRGEPLDVPADSRNHVDGLPDNFKDWMADNEERLQRAKSLPYFVRDNEKLISGATIPPAIEKPLTAQQIAQKRHAARTEDDIFNTRFEWYSRQANNLEEDLKNGLLPSSSSEAIKVIRSKIWFDLDDAQRRISLLQAASRRHAARTTQQAQDILARWAKREKVTDMLSAIAKDAKAANVEYKEVKLLKEPKSIDNIIKDLGGGDQTTGSCSSLAFAYAGNRGGLDVTDFRGGKSCGFFAYKGNIRNIVKNAGGLAERNVSDFKAVNELLKNVENGKEYYFATGNHAAIIRKVETGYEYLELQSYTSNGWKPLDKNVLKNRFKAKQSRSTMGHKLESDSFLIDIEKLQQDKGFKKMLGYINTDATKQMKGKFGRPK